MMKDHRYSRSNPDVKPSEYQCICELCGCEYHVKSENNQCPKCEHRGYLYNHKGKIVVNPRLMPEIKDFNYPSCPNDSIELAMSIAIAEWESNNIEVENVRLVRNDLYPKEYWVIIIGSNEHPSYDSKPCLYTVNEKAIVTEIL